MGRLYASTYYALHDTRTPLRFALIRVALHPRPRLPVRASNFRALLGLEPRWGAAGLTAAAGLAAWVEYALLRRRLGRRIGPTGAAAWLLPGPALERGGRAGPGAAWPAPDRGAGAAARSRRYFCLIRSASCISA